MANSAAGGVGFGAGAYLVSLLLINLGLLILCITGAAIGGGIINSIF